MTLQNTVLGLGILLMFTLVMTLVDGEHSSSQSRQAHSQDINEDASASRESNPIKQVNQASVNRTSTSTSTTTASTHIQRNDHVLALQAIEQRDWRLAELHLLRAFEQSRGDVAVVQKMIQVKRHRVDKHLTDDKHVSAAARVEEVANVLVDLTRTYMSHSSAPAELAAVAQMQREIETLRQRIRTHAINKADGKVTYAGELAEQAHWPWYSFQENDRDEVRQALQTLLWVHRRFDYVDDATRGEYFHVLAELKDLVADSEWAPLTASAGFVSKR